MFPVLETIALVGVTNTSELRFPRGRDARVGRRWVDPPLPDYLYLSFTNATAFSPTETLPVRTWAKMTMMVEAVISLTTAILVIARAVNVLPG